MEFMSYVVSGQNGFGALVSPEAENIVDLTEKLGVSDLGAALRALGPDELKSRALNSEANLPLAKLESYRPVVADPNRIFCVGLNYEEHRVEVNREKTAKPTIFLRLPHSQVGHEVPIVVPAESDCLDYEGEIAVVIGRAGRRIKPENAWSHVFGLAPYNEGSVRDWQAQTTQWTPGKNFPATGAFGPALVTTDVIGENDVLRLETLLNDERVQSADTSMLIFSIPELICYVSTFSPLCPGDIIVTGTPGGVGFKRNPPLYMKQGDKVVVSISGMRALSNPVVKEIH